MPKNLRNKKKELVAQKRVQKERAKERQKKRKEKEFIAVQLARGCSVRTIVFREEDAEEVVEAVLVYKLKEGHADPFDKDNVVYVQEADGTIVKKEKVERETEMRSVVERFVNMKMKDN